MKNYMFEGLKVIEKTTKYVIQKCKSKEAAKKLCGHLNGGCGFAGETPKFFVYVKDQK